MTPTPTPTPSPTPTVNPTRDDFPAPYMCSTRFSQLIGYNLKTVNEELKAVFMDANFNPVCEFTDPVIKANLLQNKTLSLIDVKAKCPNLQPGHYRFGLVRSSQNSLYHRNLMTGMGGLQGIPTGYPGEQMQQWLIDALDFEIKNYGIFADVAKLADGNLKIHLQGSMVGTPMVIYDINTFHGGDGTKCDNSISPLVVQMQRPEGLTRKLALTAQFQGVMFDIMGLKGYPAPHTKK